MPRAPESRRPSPGWQPPAGSPQERALARVAAHSKGGPLGAGLRITLNFHPDRLHRGEPILRRLASDGVYRSQFETGTSNGGLTAHPGGDRWRWESRLFGGAYDGAPPQARPKYGALDDRCDPVGASPRFGSAHLRLRPEVLSRCSFCYPDSVFAPVDFGVAERMALLPLARAGRLDPRADALDGYIEAHVHGPLRLAWDVEALVLDPSFRGTEVEVLAARLPCAIEWHAGFRVHADRLGAHPDYRGAVYARLGQAVARDGVLTPAILGEAARSGRHDPQDLKKVWHYLARFGHPDWARDGRPGA